MNTSFRNVVCATLLLAIPAGTATAQTSAQTPTDPYLTWSGPGYNWPQTSLPAPELESILLKDAEGNPVREFHIRGNGMDIALGIGTLRSFCKNPAVSAPTLRPGSLVLSDSNAGDCLLCFTHFDKGAFLPTVNNDALMGVAKALMEQNNPNSGAGMEIVDPPSELPRKQLLLMTRPLFLTWHLSNPASRIDLVCTDYFFTLPDGSLLVVSAISKPGNHPALRAHTEQLMLNSSIVNPDEDKKEPAKPDKTDAVESQS